MLLKNLIKDKLLKKQIPGFIPENTHYLVMMGSVAYGVSDNYSDMDVYGFCIPPKEYIFPHLAGYIRGFGSPPPNFEVWQEHHIQDEQKKRSYDVTIYGIVRYFQLVLENNPNMIDSLFVPVNCILHCTEAANLLRENKELFLHKGSWHKFKGYAFSQLNKCKTSESELELTDLLKIERDYNLPHSGSYALNSQLLLEKNVAASVRIEYQKAYEDVTQIKKRALITKLHGFDTKFAYHVVRLISEAEEILTEHTLTLDRYERREMLKDIRKGNWTLQQIRDWFGHKEKELDTLYQKSTLRHSPEEGKIKQLLLNILESHYGSLDKAVVVSDNMALKNALIEISNTVNKHHLLLG